MTDYTLTPHHRTSYKGESLLVHLVRVGDDIAGYVSINADSGRAFGQVLIDPLADDNASGHGHESIGYNLRGLDEMAQRVVDAWAARPSATALAGSGVGGWPRVWLAGEKRLTCPHCGHFNISITIRPGGIGTGPGGTWRMGDQGGHDYAYCHTCGRVSDRTY